MNNTRTDVHAPSQIVASDYEYVAVWTMNIQGFAEAEFIIRERAICKAHMERTGGTYSAHQHGGSCDICGNVQAIYLVLFYHAKSNQYIRVGVNCAQKLEMGFDFKAMEQFKRRCADAREQQAGKRKAIALLGDAGLIDAWEVFDAPYPLHATDCKAAGRTYCTLCDSNTCQHGDDNGVLNACTCDFDSRIKIHTAFPETTIRDIVGKLVKYGNISEKQSGFVGKLLKQIADRPIVEAQRKAEADAAQPVEVGRLEVSGTVLVVKEIEGRAFYYGDSGVHTKLLIRLDNGAKVWGSRFANLTKGDRARFTATFEQSKDDSKFGFFSRPVAWVSPEQRILQVFAQSWPVSA